MSETKPRVAKFHFSSEISLGMLAILSFLLPVLVGLLIGSPWLMLQNFTDGVFYLGYALQFEELVARVGLIYYSVRFGGILPDALAFSLFGPEIGLPLVRYGLAGLSCLGLFLLFSTRGSRVWGLFAAFLWAVNPAAIRFLQTAYVDVAGTYFLLLGIVLLLFPRVRTWMAFVAGLLLMLAVSSHLHAAIALFFALPLIVLVRLEAEGWRSLIIHGVWATVAAVLVAMAAAVFYFVNFGLWDWMSPTREYFQMLRDGSAANWRSSWAEVLRIGPFWLLPVPALAAYFLARSKDRLLLGSLLGLLGYIGFLFYGDVFQGGFSLSMFYYFSFVLPCLTLFFVSLGKAIVDEGEKLRWWEKLGSVWLAMAFVLPLFLMRWLGGHASGLWISILLFLSLLGFGIWNKSTPRKWIQVALFAGMSWLVAAAPTNRLALGMYWKSDDIEILGLGQQLSEILPRAKADAGILKFWFDDQNGGDLRMVQSLYLHNFTRLHREDWSAVPYSEISPEDARLLRTSGIRHLILLGLKPEEIDKGVEYLTGAGVAFELWNRTVLKERDAKIEVLHVYLPEPEVTLVQELDLSEMRAHGQASLTRTQNGRVIRSAPVKWHFDALLPIPELKPGQGVRLVFSVDAGAVDINFLSKELEGELQTPQRFSITPGKVETILWPRDPATAKILVVRNVHPKPAESITTLYRAEIVEENVRQEGDNELTAPEE